MATESLVEPSQTDIVMAPPVDVLSKHQMCDAISTTAAPSVLTNQPGVATERAASLIPPPDVMNFRAHRGRAMSRWRFFARRAAAAVALAIIIALAITPMSPLQVLIDYAAANSP